MEWWSDGVMEWWEDRHEMAKQNSPGLQPWVRPHELALKGRPMRIARKLSSRRSSLLAVDLVRTICAQNARRTQHSAALSGRVYGLLTQG
jgi:hypothetical protein